jgi:hypothetical protein
MQIVKSKLSKNQFKCYYCRHIFAMKEGDWFQWETMQVHLCRACEKVTEDKPERSRQKA